jgi:hypothetical protein
MNETIKSDAETPDQHNDRKMAGRLHKKHKRVFNSIKEYEAEPEPKGLPDINIIETEQ